jgi:hypothetical protein
LRKKKLQQVIAEAQRPEVPEVIVDFIFRQGELHVAIANVSGVSAHNVSVSFGKPFRGLGGKRDYSSLPLFKRLLFLAPYKAIETFMDTSTAYFARREPTRITATVTYRDAQGQTYERRIAHDLAIYKDIAYVVQQPAARASQSATAAPRTGDLTVWEKYYGSAKR